LSGILSLQGGDFRSLKISGVQTNIKKQLRDKRVTCIGFFLVSGVSGSSILILEAFKKHESVFEQDAQGRYDIND
jgi:hypothetical protein